MNYIEINKFINKISPTIELNDYEKSYIALKFTSINIEDEKIFKNNYLLKSCDVKIYPTKKDYLKAINNSSKIKLIDLLIKEELTELLINKKDQESIKKIYLNQYISNGYCIIKKAYDPELCKKLLNKILLLAKDERNNNKDYSYGFDNNLQRVYYCLKKEPNLIYFLNSKLLKNILELIFQRETMHNKYHMTSFHANILHPGATSQKIHLDDNIPFELPKWNIRTTFHFVIQDNTFENGATLFYPKSHLFNRAPTKYEIENLRDNDLTPLICEAGDLILWSGRLWHKSGYNKTNKSRVSLLCTFLPSFMLDQTIEENYFHFYNNEEVDKLGDNFKQFSNYFHAHKY